jgi:hypothetical protein
MAPIDPRIWDDDIDIQVYTQKAVKDFVDTRPERLVEQADVAIIASRREGVNVIKNRYFGKTGKVEDTDELIVLLCRILVEHIFKGRMTMFQEAMKERMVKSLRRKLKREIKR